MVCIEAWCSALLNEGHLEGLPDENRVVLMIPDENSDIRRHGSLEGSSSLLSLDFPTLYLVLININSRSDDITSCVPNLSPSSCYNMSRRALES